MMNQVMSRPGHRHELTADDRPVRELRQANQNMHEFLAVLGHELRSPLAAIRNGLLLLEKQGEDAAMREWARSMMQRQTDGIGRLIDDLLEISRIEHGKIQMHMLPMDLNQIVAHAVETVRPSIEGLGHRLEVTLAWEPVCVQGDPRRLEQVVTNLLNNAAKYMDTGGHIYLTVDREGDDVVLRVQDTGIGIDPEMIPHIFDPFWQGKCPSDHSQGGLGIGLALVRKIVEMHEGSVGATSSGLGFGTEFIVRIPARAGFEINLG